MLTCKRPLVDAVLLQVMRSYEGLVPQRGACPPKQGPGCLVPLGMPHGPLRPPLDPWCPSSTLLPIRGSPAFYF